MIREIAKTLKNRILYEGGLPYLDNVSGLVQTVSYKAEDENGNPLTKRFPVSYDTNIADACSARPERALTPDSTKAGIIYFEQNGAITPLRALSGGRQLMRCNIVAVVWLNRRKITGDDYGEIAPRAYEEILGRLQKSQVKSEVLPAITVTPLGFRQSPEIFSRYTYEEEVLQYLRPPFDYFAMDLNVTFIARKNCILPIELTPNNC